MSVVSNPASLLCLVCLVSFGCGSERDAPAPADDPEVPAERPPSTSSTPTETEPRRSAPPRAPEGPAAPSPSRADLPDAPSSGCRFGGPVQVWPSPAWLDVAGAADAFLIAGAAPSADGEEAFLVRVAPGAPPRTLAREAIEAPVPADHRRAAPALAVRDGHGAFALVDGQRRLLLATFELGSPTIRLAPFVDGASLRFAPALRGRASGWAVAWTDDRDTPMRVRGALAGPNGHRPEHARDLTAAGGGAASPVFVDGEDALVFVDPRQGMSVAHRVPLGPDGFGDTEVARPVSLLAEPPQIAAVHAGGSGWLAYTAVGAAATTAVGLVRLGATTPPVAVVPGAGYGVLHVDGAALEGGSRGGGAIFAADAPQSSPPSSPRSVHARHLSADGQLGPPVTIVGPGGDGARARVAVAGAAVAITFTGVDGTYVVVGRCAGAAPSDRGDHARD